MHHFEMKSSGTFNKLTLSSPQKEALCPRGGHSSCPHSPAAPRPHHHGLVSLQISVFQTLRINGNHATLQLLFLAPRMLFPPPTLTHPLGIPFTRASLGSLPGASWRSGPPQLSHSFRNLHTHPPPRRPRKWPLAVFTISVPLCGYFIPAS